MKLPKNYFENLTAARYRQYLKLLPNIQHENTRIITTLILTFTAMSFFGVFAINPTLSTIVTLKKQLEDTILVNKKLDDKINALSSLQREYSLMGADLPIIFNALPQTPKAPSLLGQVIALSQKTNTKIDSLSVAEIPLTGEKNPEEKSSFIFSMQAEGLYNDLLIFTKSLTQIDRIISIESLSISKGTSADSLILNIRGMGYYKKDL